MDFGIDTIDGRVIAALLCGASVQQAAWGNRLTATRVREIVRAHESDIPGLAEILGDDYIAKDSRPQLVTI